MTSSTELWPPLPLIRRSLTQEHPPAAAKGPATAGAAPPTAAAPAPTSDHAALLLPLTELARQREALAQRAFSARWAPGRLLSVLHEGRLLGVLLDRPAHGVPGPEQWHGWLAASEADWSGAFDLLLEPQDEPFEPLFGVVQVWNPVTLINTPVLCARVQGELSATRLAAVRALADACAAAATDTGFRAPIEAARPGRIALRAVDEFSVLTGTPLGGSTDPRHDYQALYRDAARQLVASQAGVATRGAAGAGPAAAPPSSGWAARVRRWLGGDGLWRPMMAVLALVVVVQNAGLLAPLAGSDENERWRNSPGASAGAPAAPDVRVRWKSGTDMADATALLQRADAQVVGGPDVSGSWSLRLLHPQEGRRVLQSSALVDALLPP